MLRRLTTVQLTLTRHARLVSSAASSTGNGPVHPPTRITEEEKMKILRRQMAKAERDERTDIIQALAPVKDYIEGLTRRASSRLPGGAYEESQEKIEKPSPEAYQPHTVYLLESRYHVSYGAGRVEHFEHAYGYCRTPDFEQVVRMYNSEQCPPAEKQAMDNALWPWRRPDSVKSIKWWNDNNELQEAQLDLSIPNTSPKVTVSSHGTASQPADDSWTRPGDAVKASGKDFERRDVQTDSVKHRVSEENLNDIVVQLQSRGHKVPFEVELEDGSVAHPSGFVPPTAADKFNDHAMVGQNSPPLVDSTRKRIPPEDTHSEAVPGISQWEAIKAREAEEKILMPHLTETILSRGVSAETKPRNAKIPTEIHGVGDGTDGQPTQHPSGFIPPSPMMARGEYDARITTIDSELALSDTIKKRRARYLEHIQNEPFWRPLLAITVSTRPLADTIMRLAKSLSGGSALHASVPEDDRKSKTSYPERLRQLRMDRLKSLAVGLAEALAGERGGLVGLRFSPEDGGRGTAGAGLEKPIPWEKRVIGVGVGEWVPLADEFKRGFEEVAKTIPHSRGEENLEPFLVYGLDEQGKPVDSDIVAKFPWPKTVMESPVSEEARAAVSRIKDLKKLLGRDALEGTELRVVAPKVADGSDACFDLATTFTILKEGQALPADYDPEKHHVYAGPLARDMLHQYIELLFEKYRPEIALHRAGTGSGVTYPRLGAVEDLEEMEEDGGNHDEADSVEQHVPRN
ncbi:hypothetical protein V5O48_008011 [Marasmius crinis-equi]|uniref:Uncharacterized protein n=1 Tax=Marasmius crinis-equi TaxID=585013 RepID=A0ABR3FF47_9AGAR